MKPYKTVFYSFCVGGVLALIAQAILSFWQFALTGTPMEFFTGGATLVHGPHRLRARWLCVLPVRRGMGYVWCLAAVLRLRDGRRHEGRWPMDQGKRLDGQVHLELRVVRHLV